MYRFNLNINFISYHHVQGILMKGMLILVS